MASEGKTVYVPLHDMEQTNDGKVYEDLKPGVHSVDAESGELLWSKIVVKYNFVIRVSQQL